MKQANGPNLYYVYFLASKKHGSVYIGVTNDLISRTLKHREGATAGFTKKYNVSKLVYYETFENISTAIQREKTVKKWKRDWKISLIEQHNPNWVELYPSLVNEGAF